MFKKFCYSILVLLTLSSQSVFAVDKCRCEEVEERWCCRELEFDYNGCRIKYTLCMGVFSGLHYIKVDNFTIPAECAGNINYNDLQLEAIAAAYTNYNIFPTDEPGPYTPEDTCWDKTPICPDQTACNILTQTLVCLKEIVNEDGSRTFSECNDGKFRQCYNEIRYCYDINQGKVIVEKIGFPMGPPCPEGCISACE